MTDWKKIVRETLKENEGAYDKVIDSLDKAGIKLQDVATGEYVSKGKYDDDVAKLNETITGLNEKITSISGLNNEEITKLKESHSAEMQAQSDKLQGVVKSLAIEREIGNLGITDKLQVAGLKALINAEEIKVDENFNITGGLTEQIDTLKNTYSASFEAPKVVSTGHSIQTSSKSQVGKVYSASDIDNMSVEEIMANLDAVNKSLS